MDSSTKTRDMALTRRFTRKETRTYIFSEDRPTMVVGEETEIVEETFEPKKEAIMANPTPSHPYLPWKHPGGFEPGIHVGGAVAQKAVATYNGAGSYL